MSAGQRFGRYILTARIATGGMAEVFRALAPMPGGTQREVAVKRILAQLSSDAEFTRVLLDEAALAAQLDHPNIVRVLESDSADGCCYVAMDLVEGADVGKLLSTGLQRGQPLPLGLAVFVVAEAMRGLAHAHGLQMAGRPLNLLHRDIHPGNILVSLAGEVKLGDFGLSRALDRLTMTRVGLVAGRVGYLAPEIADGRPADRRSDLFSMGVVLYDLCTRSRLFVGNSDLETLSQVRECKVPPPRSRNPEISEALERLLLRMLSADPALRFSSAAEAEQELRRVPGLGNVQALAEHARALVGPGTPGAMPGAPAFGASPAAAAGIAATFVAPGASGSPEMRTMAVSPKGPGGPPPPSSVPVDGRTMAATPGGPGAPGYPPLGGAPAAQQWPPPPGVPGMPPGAPGGPGSADMKTRAVGVPGQGQYGQGGPPGPAGMLPGGMMGMPGSGQPGWPQGAPGGGVPGGGAPSMPGGGQPGWPQGGMPGGVMGGFPGGGGLPPGVVPPAQQPMARPQGPGMPAGFPGAFAPGAMPPGGIQFGGMGGGGMGGGMAQPGGMQPQGGYPGAPTQAAQPYGSPQPVVPPGMPGGPPGQKTVIAGAMPQVVPPSAGMGVAGATVAAAPVAGPGTRAGQVQPSAGIQPATQAPARAAPQPAPAPTPGRPGWHWAAGPTATVVIAFATLVIAGLVVRPPAVVKPHTPPPPEKGEIEFKSVPAGAAVTVDGYPEAARTPLVVARKVNSTARVVATLEGYGSREQVYHFPPGRKTVTILFEMPTPKQPDAGVREVELPPPTKKPVVGKRPPVGGRQDGAMLSVYVKPSAIVYVDGRRIQQTPVTNYFLVTGSHVVQLVNEAKGRKEKMVLKIRAGRDETIRRDW